MIKRILLFFTVAIVLLVVIVLFNTFRVQSIQSVYTTNPAPALSQESIRHFQQAVQIKTISFGDSTKLDSSAFLGFQRWLIKTYPLVHANLSKVVVKQYALVYKWEGENNEAKPIVLMAHQDVVPIEEATKSMWQVDPFAGEIKDDFIWGRGTTDDKINLVSIFETVEKLLKEGIKPSRTVYLAFGHDEEMGGTGAKAIAAYLKSQNVNAEMVLDEGGIITKDKVPGMKRPAALIGTSEKGYLSLIFSVEKSGGHSSMPEKETSIDILSRAIVKLKDNPFDPKLTSTMLGFISYLGPEMPFVQKMAFTNIWLFKPMVIGIYESSAGGNAMIRTTFVPTIFQTGFKDNVIPTVAQATVNLRLLPGDSSEQIIRSLKEIINDERVKVTRNSPIRTEATGSTATDTYAYKKVDEMIKKTFDNTVSAPFLMIGGTDSRHLEGISKGIIKFSPMIDPIGFHGIDERVSLESYQLTQWFYEQLIRGLE